MRPNWQPYFLGIALEVAKRGTCLRRCYGAVLVGEDHAILSTGYCGAPRGVKNCCDTGVCPRDAAGCKSGEGYELCVSVHAEANALLSAGAARTKGAMLYIAGFYAGETTRTDDRPIIVNSAPCHFCKRLIRQAGVIRVVYFKGPDIAAIDDVSLWSVEDFRGPRSERLS